MAYFNHAFKKAFLGKTLQNTGTKFSNVFSGATQALVNPGDIGFFAAKDDQTGAAWDAYQVLVAGGTLLNIKPNEGFYIQQKSFRTSDTIGSNPGHGGYTESWKSKMILPKYINKMWKSACTDSKAQIMTVNSKAGGSNKSCFKCADTGTNNFLRIDVKGSPALRFLNHNAYMVFDTGASCTSCNGGYMNNIYAMQQFALGIIADPIISKFVQVTNLIYNIGAGAVTIAAADIATDATLNGATVAGAATWTGAFDVTITLTGAYVDTEFGTCSFDTRDNNPSVAAFGEPVTFEANFLNEDGDQCWCSASDGTTTVTTTQGAKRGNGSPYTALKDLILTDGYMQNPYNQGNKDSSRFREIEGSDQIYGNMTMTEKYHSYNLLHSIPRFNNPSGVFDNDQYHYAIYTKCSGGVNMDTHFANLETVSGVDFETITQP